MTDARPSFVAYTHLHSTATLGGRSISVLRLVARSQSQAMTEAHGSTASVLCKAAEWSTTTTASYFPNTATTASIGSTTDEQGQATSIVRDTMRVLRPTVSCRAGQAL